MTGKSDVKACIRCGSKDLKWASKSMEGIVAKEGMRFSGVDIEAAAPIAYKCNNCGYVGIPVLFDSEKDRLKFVDLKKKEARKKDGSRKK